MPRKRARACATPPARACKPATRWPAGALLLALYLRRFLDGLAAAGQPLLMGLSEGLIDAVQLLAGLALLLMAGRIWFGLDLAQAQRL
ncbi:hypothetical protein [Roseateles sp.]|uniref:hypothetical protein n=1 Tax=Roseateles sp. TaxID=1971397 RepID=UPI00286C4DF4|nr:hypothetical protein [Roseateles sp.]